MKPVLTAILLLAASSAFAEEAAWSGGAQTNLTAITNAPVKADARTGATKKSKKWNQSPYEARH